MAPNLNVKQKNEEANAVQERGTAEGLHINLFTYTCSQTAISAQQIIFLHTVGNVHYMFI